MTAEADNRGEQETRTAKVPREALLMMALAFATFNIAQGAFYGSFPVLLIALEERLQTGRDMVTLAYSAVSVSSAIAAPVVGNLALRWSMRKVMMIGAGALMVGNLALAAPVSLPVFVAIHAVFIGPALAVCGVVMPATVIPRWFRHHRGKALGFVHAPALMIAFPLVTAWIVPRYGVTLAYLCNAGWAAILLVSLLWMRDPLRDRVSRQRDNKKRQQSILEVVRPIVRSPPFWGLFITAVSVMVANGVAGAHVVALADTMGVDLAAGAWLIAVNAIAALAGPLVFGLLVDRFGGVACLTFSAFGNAVVWTMLLQQPSYTALLGIAFAMGFFAGGMLPSFTASLAAHIGRDMFAQAYGIAKFALLPFAMIAVPLVGYSYRITGSYQSAIVVMTTLMLIATPFGMVTTFLFRKKIPTAR